MNARKEEKQAGDLLTKLQMLGSDAGQGAGVWAQVVEDQLAQLDQARSRFLDRSGDGRDWSRFHGSALVIALAVGQILAFEERVRSLTGDAELAAVRRDFDSRWPSAGRVRDLVAHLDQYAVGAGIRQRPNPQPRHGPPISPKPLQQLVYWTDTGETYLSIADELHSLHALAGDATKLAAIIERTRDRYVELTVVRLNDAAQRATEEE